MMGDGRKTRKKKLNGTKETPLWLPSHPLVYKMKVGCFPVSDGTENKLDHPNGEGN